MGSFEIQTFSPVSSLLTSTFGAQRRGLEDEGTINIEIGKLQGQGQIAFLYSRVMDVPEGAYGYAPGVGLGMASD